MPDVVYYEVDGVTYMTYSQSVPSTATTTEEIEFYLFLMIENSATQSDQLLVEQALASSSNLCILMVIFVLIGVMLLTSFVAFWTGRGITKPIAIMT